MNEGQEMRTEPFEEIYTVGEEIGRLVRSDSLSFLNVISEASLSCSLRVTCARLLESTFQDL